MPSTGDERRTREKAGAGRRPTRSFAFALLACLALSAPARAASAPPRLAGLPIEVYPPAGHADTLVILMSGDGGWQALDRALAQRFAAAGLGVVGLDSFDYFLLEKTPARFARDLDRIAFAYERRWHARHVAFVGYSFGADAFPFAWPYLSARTRGMTRLVALVGLVPAADFRISLFEMLDIPSADDIPVGPALRNLPMAKVICIYGAEEKASDNTACTAPELDRAARIERPGGHHFGGDYATLARIILDRLRKPAKRH